MQDVQLVPVQDRYITPVDDRAPVPYGPAAGPMLDLRQLMLMFLRRWKLFAAVVVAIFAAVTLFTLQITPKYTATASVVLERQQQQVVDLQAAAAGLPTDSASVDTEVEVMRSRALAEKVVGDLKLERDPEFNAKLKPEPSFSIRRLLSLPSGAESGGEASLLARRELESVIDAVLAGLSVRRQGLTYVIQLSFTSVDPTKASRVANAFAESYLVEKVGTKLDATQRRSRELNSRLGTVRADAERADAELQQYKIQNNLMSSQGATLTEQQISNLNQQLALIGAQQAEAEARLSTARRQVARGSTGEDVAEALSSPVIQDLRRQRAAASQQAAALAERYGALHPERLRFESQVADLDTQITAEVQRVISNLEAQAQVARQRTASLQASINQTRGALEDNNRASVRLNELQNKATSARAIYEAFLNSFKESSAQEGLEQSNARIVARAKIPNGASSPNVPLNLALGLVLGLGAGVGAVFLREAFDSGLTTADGVETQLELPYLGGIPDLASVAKDDPAARELNPIDYVVRKPLSSFAESFRNLRTSVSFSRRGQPVQVVAITSTVPGEGKTTSSWCLARTAALAGSSVVLVDCDLRRRTASHMIKEPPRIGLIEVIHGQATLDEALVDDAATPLKILPLSRSAQTVRDVFGTPEMTQVLADLRTRFDLVILDTAPVIAVAETRVMGQEADAVVLLARWRKTPKKAIESALRALNSTGAYVAGVSLTMIDMKAQEKYGYGDSGYYYSSYSRYYHQ